MEFIKGLPKSDGKDIILVVVDRFTKFAHFLPLSHPFSAPKVAQEFFDLVYKLHGLPVTIISDRDPIFLSRFWSELLQKVGIKLNLTTAYHPQSDGQCERVNPCVENSLFTMHDFKQTQALE